MITPMLSGHCATPSTVSATDALTSHERCQRNGGGNKARPSKEFQPCPCPCHFPEEEFECSCGGTLKEAAHWPMEVEQGKNTIVIEPGDDDYEMVYTHINPRTGLATGEECP